MKHSYPVERGKETWKHLQQITRFGYSSADIFRDFVDIVLAALLSFTDNFERLPYETFIEHLSQNTLDGVYEERYLSFVERYKENKTRKSGERPMDFFTTAWGCLQQETQESQADILGELYESQISFGEHGQFFTPPNIARMITEMLAPTEDERVMEPACGSGRLIIAAAKKSPETHFYGIDVSPVCARMCALNMWLFNLNADIYEGNTLSMEMSYLWRIRKGGWIWESRIGAQIASQKPEAHLQEKKVQPEVPPQPPEPEKKAVSVQKQKKPPKAKKGQVAQPTLFDFGEE